jgi:carbamoyltransferase
VSDIEKEIAKLIVAGNIVAICRGGQEYGPRALGNHSILAKTDDITLIELLNKKLNRTEFMPFAPVTLDTHSELCYSGIQGAELASSLMTITLNCTTFMKEKSPAVVHVDGTARPQIIKRKDNAFLYDIVSYYYKLTGIPSLLNTSFNVHEEPIVFFPENAIKTFITAELDYLILDQLLLRKRNEEISSC